MTFHPHALLPPVLASVLLAVAQSASAQAARTEELDVTRLDVERLPPEAIEIDREMYSHGVFVEGHLGGRGFIGGAGRYFDPGMLASIGGGYEVTSWLLVGAAAEFSFHPTDAPAPPTATTLQIVGGLLEARLQANVGSRFAPWIGGEVGLMTVSGNFLTTYGVQDAESIGPMFGGSLGLDWHFPNRHHSLGLRGGARLYPSLAGFDGEPSLGVHTTMYLRYVF